MNTPNVSHDGLAVPEASREADTVSNSHERKMPVVKIRVRQSAASSRAEEADNPTVDKSPGAHNETDRGGGSSSISVDAPQRNFTEAASISNQNLEEVNSCHDRSSRMTASIGSAKLASDGDELGRELQCTADSGKISLHPQSDEGLTPSGVLEILEGSMQDNIIDADAQKFASLQTLSVVRHEAEGGPGPVASVRTQSHGKSKEKKKEKDKDKKRKREDPEYLERKRLKKEKKQREKEMAQLLSGESKHKEKEISELLSGEAKHREKEMAKLLSGEAKPAASAEVGVRKEESGIQSATVQYKASETNVSKVVAAATKAEASEGSSAPKFRIKFKKSK